MPNEEPFDDLDKQPAAADEGGQGFDDPAFSQFGEEGPEPGLSHLYRFFSDLRRCFPLAFRHSRYPFSTQKV